MSEAWLLLELAGYAALLLWGCLPAVLPGLVDLVALVRLTAMAVASLQDRIQRPQPAPKTPATFESGRDSARAATPPAAPVRIIPSRFASTMPSRLPRSALKT